LRPASLQRRWSRNVDEVLVLHEDHLVGAVWRVILDRAGERYVAMRYYPRRFVGFYLTAKAAKQVITQHLDAEPSLPDGS